MNGLNIKQFEYVRGAGIVLNRWERYHYDAQGYEKGWACALALTYGCGYDGGDELRLIMLTNGDPVIPEHGDLDALAALLTDVGDGDANEGYAAVMSALLWAEEHLDTAFHHYYGAIEDMREQAYAALSQIVDDDDE